MAVIYFLLLYTTFGILTINEQYEGVHGPLDDSNSNICINPDGLLYLLHGYIFYENRLMHMKRLFSPGFKINYSLTETEDKLIFKHNNTKDVINNFKMPNKDTFKYLLQYYRVVRTMHSVVNGKANIQTCRDESLFRFLTQKLNKEDSFKLLAIMLFLAEEVDFPVERACQQNY
ncbi:hypothetical protein PAEPH01_1672 [Pancytospora epiphaga]|nr:hypothetical protein PAEPH01_1672 [Pancytospora epiphaga]